MDNLYYCIAKNYQTEINVRIFRNVVECRIDLFNLLRWNEFLYQYCNIFSVLSIFERNKIGETDNKFITYQ